MTTTQETITAAAHAWRATGVARRPRDVATEYGLDEASIPTLHRLVPELSLPSEREHAKTTREDMVAAVRAVAQRNGLTGWFSTGTYDRLRIGGEPSGALITSRFKWREIATDAGLDPSQSKEQVPGFGDRLFSDDDLDSAVLEFINSPDRKSLSAAEMERFLVARPDLPSMATVRNRFRRQRGIGSIAGIYRDVLSRVPAA